MEILDLRELISNYFSDSWGFIEESSNSLKIKFQKKDNDAKLNFSFKLLELIFSKKIKLNKIVFLLKDKQGGEFEFYLNNPDTSQSVVALNNFVALYLTPEDIQRLNEFNPNSQGEKRSIICGFSLNHLKALNYTAFHLHTLIECELRK